MTLEKAALLSVRIFRKIEEAEGAVRLDLVPVAGQSLPTFTAGSHIDLYLPNGLVRQYSLCNSPSDRDKYVLCVQRDPSSRGGSLAVHELLNEGETLQISAPRNLFPLQLDASHSILLAGGIGITPILSMAEQLLSSGKSYELHYSCRSETQAAFKARLLSPEMKPHSYLHISQASEGAGRVEFAKLLSSPAANVHLYVCGSSAYIESALSAARVAGWPEECLHREFFSAEPKSSTRDKVFRIYLAKRDKSIWVGQEQTALEALMQSGVEVPSSCEQGVCGTCLTKVISGVPDHRDSFLTPQEQAKNDQFLPCCSRAKSEELVLDL